MSIDPAALAVFISATCLLMARGVKVSPEFIARYRAAATVPRTLGNDSAPWETPWLIYLPLIIPFPCQKARLSLCILMTTMPQPHRFHTNAISGCVLHLYLCGAPWLLACSHALISRAARLRGGMEASLIRSKLGLGSSWTMMHTHISNALMVDRNAV